MRSDWLFNDNSILGSGGSDWCSDIRQRTNNLPKKGNIELFIVILKAEPEI